MEAVHEVSEGALINIDGKTLSGSVLPPTLLTIKNGLKAMFCENIKLNNLLNGVFALSKTLYFLHPVYFWKIRNGLWFWRCL
jgi:hypothetical protein